MQSHRKASILKQAVVRGLADFFAVPPGGSSQVTMLACGLWFLDVTQPPWGPSCGGAPSWVLGLGDPGSLAGMLRGLMVFPQCASYMSLSLPFLATGVTWTTRSSSQLPAPDPLNLLSTHCLFAQKPSRASHQGRKKYKGAPSRSPRPWAALGALHSLAFAPLTFSHSPSLPLIPSFPWHLVSC